jgi:hypothetical protein
MTPLKSIMILAVLYDIRETELDLPLPEPTSSGLKILTKCTPEYDELRPIFGWTGMTSSSGHLSTLHNMLVCQLEKHLKMHLTNKTQHFMFNIIKKM